MKLLDCLTMTGFIPVNRALIKRLGRDTALFFSEIINEFGYWQSQNKLRSFKEKDGTYDGGWFFSTIENIENNTTLSGHEQRKIIKQLVELNLIQTTHKGVPQVRYFKLNQDAIEEFLSKLEN